MTLPNFLLQVLPLAFLCGAITGCSPDESPLKFENRSDSLVKGCYCQNERLSLCFEIQPGFIQLTDKNNSILVRFSKLTHQRSHVKVLGDNFLWRHPASEPLFVGEEANNDSIFEGEAGYARDMGQSSSMRYQGATLRLRKKPQIQLLLHVSHSLQNKARNIAMIKAFHVMSMSLLGKHNVAVPARDEETAAHRYLSLFDRKRGTCKDLRGDPNRNRCLGMCGPQCWCWKIVCGDCCYHRGCYEHDACCVARRFSGYCMLPFLHGFGCDSYGGYPSCLKKSLQLIFF